MRRALYIIFVSLFVFIASFTFISLVSFIFVSLILTPSLISSSSPHQSFVKINTRLKRVHTENDEMV